MAVHPIITIFTTLAVTTSELLIADPGPFTAAGIETIVHTVSGLAVYAAVLSIEIERALQSDADSERDRVSKVVSSEGFVREVLAWDESDLYGEVVYYFALRCGPHKELDFALVERGREGGRAISNCVLQGVCKKGLVISLSGFQSLLNVNI